VHGNVDHAPVVYNSVIVGLSLLNALCNKIDNLLVHTFLA